MKIITTICATLCVTVPLIADQSPKPFDTFTQRFSHHAPEIISWAKERGIETGLITIIKQIATETRPLEEVIQDPEVVALGEQLYVDTWKQYQETLLDLQAFDYIWKDREHSDEYFARRSKVIMLNLDKLVERYSADLVVPPYQEFSIEQLVIYNDHIEVEKNKRLCYAALFALKKFQEEAGAA